jgi:hypothetical protein
MNEDIVVPIAFFISVVVIVIVVPIVRAIVRRSEREERHAGLTPALEARLDRIESMIETVAVEVERLAEGQRFTTRLLSEGSAHSVMQKARDAASAQGSATEVRHA